MCGASPALRYLFRAAARDVEISGDAVVAGAVYGLW
jgi:hypothetical protein